MHSITQLQSIINAIGWTLIHFLWQGLVIAAVYWAVCKSTRAESALIRYWVGMLAFVSALLIPGATFLMYWDVSNTPLLGASLGSAQPLVSVSAGVKPAITQILGSLMQPAIPVVVMLWAAGVAVLSLRACLGWFGVRRLVELDTIEVGESLQLITQRLKEKLGVHQAVRVLQSGRVTVPTVVGWLKPAILLPISVLARLPEDQLEMIIAHELGHIRRHDYLFNLLQIIIETLFFYHPAMRWMSRQVRQEREHCCDDVVLSHCESPVLYARALANLEILRAPLPGMALSASGGDLVYRVKRIVQSELPGSQSGFAQLIVMLGIATMVAVSAQQGLEIRRHLMEKSISSQQVRQPEWQTDTSRSGWVAGVSDYATSRLVESARRRTEPPQLPHVQTLPESRESVLRAHQVVVTKQAAPLPELPLAFDFQDRDDPVHGFTPAGSGSEFGLPVDINVEGLLAYVPAPDEAADTGREELPLSANGVTESFSLTPQFTVAPVYPFKARRKRMEGQVRLEFSINPSGRPSDIRVVESTPSDVFDESAVRALEKWKFDPNDVREENGRLYQVFDFAMDDRGPVVPKRERRCDITGSRICGTQAYNVKDADPSG